MTQLFTNNASAKLAASVAPGDLTFDVQAGQGTEFSTPSGSDFFIATLESIDGTTREIVKVTGRSTDTMTVTRAQEGTSAGTFAAGDKFDCRLTAGALATIEAMVYDAELLALAGLTSAANKIPEFTGSGTATLLTKDTDGTLAADSDANIPTQKAVKTYVDAAVGGVSSTLDGLSDVVVPSPSDGDVLTFDNGSGHWINAAPTGGGIARSSVTKTTASLANNAAETGTVTMAKWGEMGEISVDRDCRVRLYATSADRTADASRPLGTPCPTTTSMLAEWSFQSGTVGANTQSLRRLSVGFYNADGSPASSIYYEIVNLSQATSTVAVTIHFLPLET
jgi:hypothetical protein